MINRTRPQKGVSVYRLHPYPKTARSWVPDFYADAFFGTKRVQVGVLALGGGLIYVGSAHLPLDN
jgi:hypothetical protein